MGAMDRISSIRDLFQVRAERLDLEAIRIGDTSFVKAVGRDQDPEIRRILALNMTHDRPETEGRR